jgi:cytochrome c
MRLVSLSMLALILAVSISSQARADGDPTRGKSVFNRCGACHTATMPNKIGPHLAGVVGRKAGSVEGFKYSKAMPASGLVWDDQTLNTFLTAPAKAVPGTTMALSVPNAKDREDVIAYLKTLPGQ